MILQFVFPGACLNSNICVLEKTDCPGGSGEYRSPRQILNGMQGLDGTGPGSECMPNPNSASQIAITDMFDQVHIGRCTDRNGNADFCTSTASSCGSFQFNAMDEGCRVYDDLAVGSPVRNSFFGKCGTDCVWSQESCSSGVFTSAATLINNNDKCLSEDVRVGACRGPGDAGEYFCAVSANACDDSSIFIDADTLANDGISCRLTEGSLPRSTEYKTYTGDSNRNNSNNNSPDRNPSGANNNISSNESDNKTAIIAGSVVGGVAGLAIIGGLFCWCSRRRRGAGGQEQAKSHKESSGTDKEEANDTRQIA